VAVASRFFAVGSVVPHARAGSGAVAPQASANTSFGPNGLDLMARSLGAEEALKVLLRGEDGGAQPAMLPEVAYDLAVIRLAAGDRPGAITAARRALALNPKLAAQAKSDPDLEAIRPDLP
jgi:hypothetical protein